MNRPAQTRSFAVYRQAAETMSPAQQIVALYEGASRFLREAKEAIAAGEIERRHRLVSRAYSVINALHCCLDYEQGGDMAQMLDRYYRYVLHRMTMIDIKNDPAICDELIARLGEMRASWACIADGSTGQPGTPTAPSRAATAMALCA